MAIFKGFSAVLCASTALALAAPAWAQEAADENSGGIEDIVVTAQKRAESAQEVPIAISVFSGDALAERAITNVSQLTSVAPNVNFDNGVAFTGSTAVLAASIRGIGSSDFAFNIDPGVGVYVDGIYLARSVGANQDLLDTGRIEVLKGPQGTLFGRNTIGGAVSIVTRDPAKEFKARGDVTFGRFNMFEARAAVDVPLTDNLTSLITFDVRNGGAYGKRIPFPSALVANSKPYTALPAVGYEAPSKEGSNENAAIRAKIKYDGGNFRVTLSGDYQHSTGNSPHSLLAALGDPAVTGSPNFTFLYNTCRAAPTSVLGALGLMNYCSTFGTQLPSVRRDEVTPINRVTYTPGVNTGANPATHELLFTDQFITGDPDVSYATGNNFSKLTNYSTTLNAELDLTPDIMLKSITGYRHSRWKSGLDMDSSPLNIMHASFDQRQRQISQEFQLVGNAMDEKLNFVLGAYFFNEKGYLLDLVSFAQGAVQIDGPNWFNTTNYATFAQLDFKMNDLISFTLGARYTSEKKAFEGGQQEVNGVFYKLVGSAAFAGTPLGDPALSNICADTVGFLMMAHMTDVEMLVSQALLMESYGATTVYCVDSAGYMLPADVTARVSAMRAALKPGTEIGFHGHHNLAMGVSNSLAAIAAGANRIDGSAAGFGAGAGNTPLEVFAAVAERMGIETGIDVFKLMDVAEDSVLPMMAKPPRADRDSLTLGYAGVYSTFLYNAKDCERRYGLPARDLLMELGRLKMIGGQEDMIEDTALTMAKARGLIAADA